MIQGILREDGRPAIPLIIGWSLGVQEIVAIVDTGSNGEIKVPPKMVNELGLVITHVQGVLLANETMAEAPAALAFVVMEGVTEEVNVLVTQGMPVIGAGLLKRFGFKLTIDFKGNTVLLEK